MSFRGGGSLFTAHEPREARPDEQSTTEDATKKHHETVTRDKKRVQTGKARAAKAMSAPIAELDVGESVLETALVSTTVGADYQAQVQNFVTEAVLSSGTVEQIGTALRLFHRSALDAFSVQDGAKMIAALPPQSSRANW